MRSKLLVTKHKQSQRLPSLRYPLVLLGLLPLVLLWSGIGPHSRFDWFVDNALGIVLLVLVAVSGRYFRLSNISYTAMIAFMALHVIGSNKKKGTGVFSPRKRLPSRMAPS